MIRSASLLYALIVSLLLSGLLGGVILASGLRSVRTERWLARQIARDNAYSGMLRCTLFDDRGSAIGSRMDLFGLGSDSVTMEMDQWGLFRHCRCTAVRSDQVVSVAGLMAQRWPAHAPSIHVADHGEPIALAGNTRIEGPCLLPASGLRRAYIEGRPYQGTLHIEGMGTSERSIPELPPFVLHSLEEMLALNDEGSGSGAVEWSGLSADTLRPGNDAILDVDASGEQELADRVLIGRIRIMSRDTLRLRRTMRATGIVVIARYIIIEDGLEGSFQCFSRQGISVGTAVRLAYPSVLACMNSGHAPAAAIRIGEGSVIEGAIIGKAGRDASREQVSIELEKGTHLAGELWCDGPVQLQGNFEGTLIADRLVLRTASSVYRDHLLDAVITPMRDPRFACLGLWDVNAAGTVLAWDPPSNAP